jgi:hypothetical protein
MEPLFWWLMRSKRHQPHAYVCPALMTISILVYRARGKKAYWSICKYASDGRITQPSRALHGHAEINCLFPRKMILMECDFWNSRFGLKLRSKSA